MSLIDYYQILHKSKNFINLADALILCIFNNPISHSYPIFVKRYKNKYSKKRVPSEKQ